jgi:hypothetical protein
MIFTCAFTRSIRLALVKTGEMTRHVMKFVCLFVFVFFFHACYTKEHGQLAGENCWPKKKKKTKRKTKPTSFDCECGIKSLLLDDDRWLVELSNSVP